MQRTEEMCSKSIHIDIVTKPYSKCTLTQNSTLKMSSNLFPIVYVPTWAPCSYRQKYISNQSDPVQLLLYQCRL